MAILLNVGAVSAFVSLDDCLREVREAAIENTKAEIESRKKAGIPLDDATNFAAAKAELQKAIEACDALDSVAIKDVARVLLRDVSEPLAVPPDYAQPENIDGVFVRFVAMSEAKRSALSIQVGMANEAEQEALRAGHARTVIEAKSQAVIDAVGEYIREGIKDIDGLNEYVDGKIVPMQPCLPSTDALVKSGLLWHLYVAARHFQGLPAKKACRFGSLRE